MKRFSGYFFISSRVACLLVLMLFFEQNNAALVGTTQTLEQKAEALKKEATKALEQAEKFDSFDAKFPAQLKVDQADYELLVAGEQKLLEQLSKTTKPEEQTSIKNQLSKQRQDIFDFYENRMDVPFIKNISYLLEQKVKKSTRSGQPLQLYKDEFNRMKEGEPSTVLPGRVYGMDYYSRQRLVLIYLLEKVNALNDISNERVKLRQNIRKRLQEIVDFRAKNPLANNSIDEALSLAKTIPSDRLKKIEGYIKNIANLTQGWLITGRAEATRYLDKQVRELQEIVRSYNIQSQTIADTVQTLDQLLRKLKINPEFTELSRRLGLQGKIPYEQWKQLHDEAVAAVQGADKSTLERLSKAVEAMEKLELDLLKNAQDVIEFLSTSVKNSSSKVGKK
jgi:hypothetical protein